MSGAKEFLEKSKQFIDEIKDMNEFNTKVMKSEKPVILDCYAE